ncbi:Zinc finger, CCCH-type [Sesbania bispinosa]|nr:Zinc finger, CCCH-type [Sesbania bispinosa]
MLIVEHLSVVAWSVALPGIADANSCYYSLSSLLNPKCPKIPSTMSISSSQVKLFLSEDYPSKVGQKLPDHLQAKISSTLHSSTNESDDLPPGFESSHFLNRRKVEFSHISQIKWERPPRLVFSSHWRVAAGEESREREAQKLREMKVLEAVYPRISAIPPSPSVSLDVEEEDYDDNITPLVSIIPIEEEESINSVTLPHNVQSQNLQQYISAMTPISSDCNTSHTVSFDACGALISGGVSLGSEADLAAASAIVAAIVKSNEQGRLVDMDLLVEIFNDPKMIEKLTKENRIATTTVSASSKAVDIPSSGSKPAIPSVSLLNPTPDKPATASVPLSRPVSGKPVSPSVLLPTVTPAPHMLRSVNNNIHHVSNGIPTALNTQPRQDTVLASGVKRAASLPSIASSELSSVTLPSATGNLHTVVNQGQSTASTMPPYQLNTGSECAVKDANYYKNLVRQHGADKQDSQIGIRHSNFQDLKPVHNINKGEVKHKIQKPCIYFKSSRGCRNGNNCPYQHDVSVHWGAELGNREEDERRRSEEEWDISFIGLPISLVVLGIGGRILI